jgi:Acyltransferase family.
MTKNWSPELEGLRGVASLWVFLGHIALLVNCKIPIIAVPKLGVDLFILLSGYLMTKNLSNGRTGNRGARGKPSKPSGCVAIFALRLCIT